MLIDLDERCNNVMSNFLRYDIVIIGSGLVGASLAIALLNHGLKVAVIEKNPHQSNIGNPKSTPNFDSRAIALSYTSVQCLKTLNIPIEQCEHAEPILSVQISEQGSFGRTHIQAKAMNLPYLGLVTSADILNNMLNQSLKDHLEYHSDLTIFYADIKTIAQKPEHWQMVLSDGNVLQTALIVGADGAHSFIRQYQGISVTTQEFSHSAIVVNVQLNQPHQGIAFERFMPKGSVALLPLSENRTKCVWIVENEKLEYWMTLSEKGFLDILQKNFGYQLGIFQALGKRSMYPLKQIFTDNLYGAGWVLMGNAANTLHPIAAQGFNLGLRDAATLAEIVIENSAFKKLNSIELLRQYASKRYDDHHRVKMFTQLLIEDNAQRRLGILACEIIPFIHRWVSEVGIGLQAELPKLMRGVAL